MHSRKPLVLLIGIVAGCTVGLGACTDAGLYQWRHDPYQANKLTLSGTVCTDDPQQRNFPVKILFIMDTSASLMSEDNDSEGWRGKAIDEIVTLWAKNPNYHFGVIAYGAKARNLIEGGFTRDASLLSAAAASVQGSGGISAPGGCIAGRCRDLQAAVGLASSIVTGDILAGSPGEVARTTYVLVLFSGGPPVPPLGRCGCRDKSTEAGEKKWANCPWSECEGCKVTCPANATCKDDLCIPVCPGGCDWGYYCDRGSLCKEGEPSGQPVEDPISSQPTSVPDTFTQWVPPAEPGFPLPSGAQSCNLSCVYQSGQGHADSCEEKTIVSQVRDLREFAKANGATQLQLHTTYLPDKTTRDPTSPFYPPCSPEADQARAVRLLSEMAFTGKGGFTQFGAASTISFRTLDLHTSRDPLVIKELVVSNANVLADSHGLQIDTDGDGITDEKERELGTCPSDEDTDGDGLQDSVEVKLAHDPLKPDDPVECIDLPSTLESGPDPCDASGATTKTWKHFADQDGDELNACEERLLGLQDTLFDSDADGIPDKLEFIAGTNFLAVDTLQDMDLDGIVNRDEIRGHTNARSNDAQSQLDLAYRYEEVDEGIKDVRSFTQPPNLTGITIKNVSANSGNGIGWLKFNPGPPPTLSWRDPADMGPGGNFGPEVEITRSAKDGYRITSCLAEVGGSCTPDSLDRFITVTVEGEASYRPIPTTDLIVISSAQRNCLRFRVRNITLMETGLHRLLGSSGNNTVNIYFAEAPENAKDGYGIFRIRSLQLNYRKGPPEVRTPRIAEITLTDDDFAIFE